MENESKIYELIEKYDFSELNESQQQLVLLNMTIEEYVELRKTVLSTSSFFANEPILIAEDLVAPTIKRERILIKMINYKLPIYKVAAILVIVLSISKLIPEKQDKETQLAEINTEMPDNSEKFKSYQQYSSNNAIKYDIGLSSVLN